MSYRIISAGLGLILCSLAVVSAPAWADVQQPPTPARVPAEPADDSTLAPNPDFATSDSPLGEQSGEPSDAAEGVLEVLTTSALPDGQVHAQTVVAQAADMPELAEIAAEPAPVEPVVHSDYAEAMREAVEDRKLLFIYFCEPTPDAATRAFDQLTLADQGIQEQLKRFVVARLPRDAQITVSGEPVKLLEHPAFAEMHGRQGIAIIDLAHARSEYYGHVVSTFPFTTGKFYRKEALSIILDLPPGTLTQRTMIYAVRIHPEAPASTQGQFHTVLADEAKQQSDHQAAILLQGHHSWDTRFHRISAKLDGALAEEVVAESWPNETLVEACVDCVHSWRQSPGHWGAVRARHSLFGYDIKRGRNGIWYATGIFGRR